MVQTRNVNDDVSLSQLEVFANDLNPKKAASIYKKRGALVVRGLMLPYCEQIRLDIEEVVKTAISRLDRAERVVEGWRTPEGTLFIPAPEGYDRKQQVMVVACSYDNSGAFLRSAVDEKLLDIVAEILGPDVEIFGKGQVIYKEPVGGHPKHLHQDAAYFEHRYGGPVGVLSYAVDTDETNGALHVVPGSHKLNVLNHINTVSHLGLDWDEWPWERALRIDGKAGDSIFFNVNTIHGSKENNSSAPRPVFIHRYRRADDYIVVSGTTAENRADAASRSKEAKKNDQYGLMVRGFRKFEE